MNISRTGWHFRFHVLAVLLMTHALPCAALELPRIFQSHMVLQRHKPIPVWGLAQPGHRVTVSFGEQEAAGLADAENGQWVVELPAMPASDQGRVMTITQRPASAADSTDGSGSESNSDTTVTFDDVLVGEVWLCSGQSNIEWPLRRDGDADQEIANANLPMIRVFKVTPYRTDLSPQNDLPEDSDADWKVCTPESAPEITAVGYYFARRLHDELNVPVGIVSSYWGGTRIESWMSRPTLEATPASQSILKHFDDIAASWKSKSAEWKEKPKFHSDPGDVMETNRLAQGLLTEQEFKKAASDAGVEVDTSVESVELPAVMPRDFDGVVWFATSVELSDAWVGQNLTLELGVIDDFDVAYVNGTEIGRTGVKTKNWWQTERRYTVPAETLKAGPNTIAVRIMDQCLSGGMMGDSARLTLGPDERKSESPRGDTNTVNRNGASLSEIPLLRWQMYAQNRLDPKDIRGPGGDIPYGPGSHHQPAGLYNAMIHPLAPYAMRGVLWYQGESNAGRSEQYRGLQPALIYDWRRAWAASPWSSTSIDVPVDAEEPLWFFIAQLPNFKAFIEKPSETGWTELRDAQLNTLRHVSRTGLAITTDLGNPKDIHPKNKRDVGGRLARWALVDTYGRSGIIKSGPLYEEAHFVGGEAIISFDLFGSPMAIAATPRSDISTLGGFTLAGHDHVFHRAKARIDGDTVRVSCDAVPQPVAVRYAWQPNPEDANLFNAAGLPASPFRSDDWPGVTADVMIHP